MTSRPTVLAVLASHDRKAQTLACLDALLCCDGPADVAAVLLDDGSTDGTVEAVRRTFPQVAILRGDGDLFWAGAMRVAFAAARERDPDFYLWLNDDVRLAPDALQRLLQADRALAAQGHALRLVGGAVADAATGRTSYAGILRASARRPLRFRRCEPHPSAALPCDTLVGNVVLIGRGTAAAIGGIDPAYRHTLADLDYGLRVTAAGGRCVLAPGHVGWCAPNRRANRWFNPDLPLAARWRLVGQPLGFPLRPWLQFARRHGGPAWIIFALLPYWRLFVPVALARRVDCRRADITVASASHA